MTRLASLVLLFALSCAAAAAPPAASGTAVPATVHKPAVKAHAAADLKAPTVATLKKGETVRVSGQQGLWFQVALADGKTGFVRVNDVRLGYAKGAASGSNLGALFTGKAGKGRVTETAGVRGIDESDLKSSGFDAAQFAKYESHRQSPAAAAAEARRQGLSARQVPYPGETGAPAGSPTQAQKRGGLAFARGLISALGGGSTATDSALDVADRSAGKSEAEQAAEELALGPEIAGRILGAAPLWNDGQAQQRVNRIGRWMASQTARPDLPWTFGVVDTPDVNAFAAPGGYVLLTRGMYELLSTDDEVAAVLGHELAHVVQRDHYNVIRKQETRAAVQDAAAANVDVGGGAAGAMAKDYVRRHGAAVMLASLDREAEYRSDEAARIYLARAGYDPLALYAVLQKMMALGSDSGSLAQLYKTHPPLDARLDRLDRRGFDVH